MMVVEKTSPLFRLAGDGDVPAVMRLIHSIQVGEFAVPINMDDQPDIGSIEAVYINAGGAFYVVEAGERIVGSIGLEILDGGHAALRKLYVAKEFRAKGLGVAKKLLSLVLEHAAKNGVVLIYLGVAEEFASARRFYEKTGFHLIEENELPIDFPKTPVDRYFYRLSVIK